MKTAIVYYSRHHGNTKKLLDAIAQENDVTLFDVTKTPPDDLSAYDRIGFASGIYYSGFQKSLLEYAQAHMPQNKQTFFIYTCGSGSGSKRYTNAIAAAVGKHNAAVLGTFGCRGFDTFGPFRLVGGISKGYPDECELKSVCTFYKGL